MPVWALCVNPSWLFPKRCPLASLCGHACGPGLLPVGRNQPPGVVSGDLSAFPWEAPPRAPKRVPGGRAAASPPAAGSPCPLIHTGAQILLVAEASVPVSTARTGPRRLALCPSSATGWPCALGKFRGSRLSHRHHGQRVCGLSGPLQPCATPGH